MTSGETSPVVSGSALDREESRRDNVCVSPTSRAPPVRTSTHAARTRTHTARTRQAGVDHVSHRQVIRRADKATGGRMNHLSVPTDSVLFVSRSSGGSISPSGRSKAAFQGTPKRCRSGLKLILAFPSTSPRFSYIRLPLLSVWRHL